MFCLFFLNHRFEVTSFLFVMFNTLPTILTDIWISRIVVFSFRIHQPVLTCFWTFNPPPKLPRNARGNIRGFKDHDGNGNENVAWKY